MTSMFENETIDHCLTAYQHHVDLRYRNCLAFSVRRSCFSGGEERPPHSPPVMHFSLISTSAFIKRCDTSEVLKLKCLKIQACSVVIISVSKQLSNGYIRVGTPPTPSPWVGHQTRESNRFNKLNRAIFV